MPRLLAIEWDSREARVAVADARRGRVAIEQAFAVPLPARAEGASAEDAGIGEAIAEALAERKARNLPALVALGRANIELKLLSLPPAPDEELPDLARFQAQREFNSLGENWPFDFAPIGDQADGPRQVLAAAVAPDVVEHIQTTCRRAGVKPTHLVLRPYAAASLLRRSPQAGPERVRLLVDILVDEADLTVLVGSQVVFLRTARLPAAAAGADEWRPLVAEIRRTMAAVHNQLGGERVEAIYLCDVQQEHAPLAARLREELSLDVTLFDPFREVTLDARLVGQLPAHAGRFAPLVGMLVDEAAEATHGLDFLQPRKRPPPPSRKRPLAIAGVGCALAALLLGGWAWWSMRALDRDIAELTKQSESANPTVEAAKRYSDALKDVEGWTNGEVVWLDEMARLARDLPPAQDVMLTDLSMAPHPDGGEIVLQGLVRATPVVDQLEAKLRDAKHRVGGSGRQQSPQNATYPWSFSTAVIVGEKPPAPAPARTTPGSRRATPATRGAAPAAKARGT